MALNRLPIETPEGQADQLEGLVNRPDDLREIMEARVNALLRGAEISARFSATVFRRIRDKELFKPAGWASWTVFCGYFCPGQPERFATLIRALEVLETRGDGRDFSAGQAAAILEAAPLALTHAEAGKKGGRGNKAHDNRHSFRGSSDPDYLAARLKRDHPEIAAEVARGEHKSIRAAAIAAGIVKPPDAYKALRAAWGRATPEQRAAIAIGHGHREAPTVVDHGVAPAIEGRRNAPLMQLPTPEQAIEYGRGSAYDAMLRILPQAEAVLMVPFFVKELLRVEAWRERPSALGHKVVSGSLHRLIHEPPPDGLRSNYATIEG